MFELLNIAASTVPAALRGAGRRGMGVFG